MSNNLSVQVVQNLPVRCIRTGSVVLLAVHPKYTMLFTQILNAIWSSTGKGAAAWLGLVWFGLLAAVELVKNNLDSHSNLRFCGFAFMGFPDCYRSVANIGIALR